MPPKKVKKAKVTPIPSVVEQVEAIVQKTPSRPRRHVKTKRVRRELTAIDREKYPRTGQFIHKALESGPTYIADLHQQYRKMQQEAALHRGVIHKVATYHSFLTYCEKLILAGLLERTGERRPSSNPLTEPIDNPDRIYVQLTDKGLHAGEVWDAPLKFWYHGGGVDSQYIRSEATPRKPSVTKKPVVEKPIIERVKPRKEPKEKPPVSLLLPDLYAMRLKWLKFNPYQVPVKEIIDDITALPSRLDTRSCKEAINQYTRGLQMLKPNDPASRDNLTSRWYWVLNCLQGIIDQEEGRPSPATKRPSPPAPIIAPISVVPSGPPEKTTRRKESKKAEETSAKVTTLSQFRDKWAEKKDLHGIGLDLIQLEIQGIDVSELVFLHGELKRTYTENLKKENAAVWKQFTKELDKLVAQEEGQSVVEEGTVIPLVTVIQEDAPAPTTEATSKEVMLPSQLYAKWEDREKRNTKYVEKDIKKIPSQYNTNELLNKLEDVRMSDDPDDKEAAWTEFFDELGYLVTEEEEEEK